MLLSRAWEYALQALLYIAVAPEGKYILTREIAQHHNLSYHFLGKVLQTLVKNRLLDSQKGPSGGFALAKAANKITLSEVIHAVEGPDFLEGCVVGLPRCNEMHPCPLHDQWLQIKHHIHNMFTNRTVAQLLDVAKQRGLDLSIFNE